MPPSRRAFAVVAGTSVLAACLPSAAQPSSSTAPAESVVVEGVQGTGTVRVDEVRWSTTGRPGPKHGHYLSVRLTWHATRGNLSLNPARITFRDASGAARPFAYYGPDVTPVLESTSLVAGSDHTSWVSFDAVAGAGEIVILAESNAEAARVPVPGP